MTLRNKTIFIIGGSALGLVALLFAVGQSILTDSFVRTEEVYVRQNVQRALKAYSYELTMLQASAKDWAAWDNTYAFIEDGNPEYVQANLVNSIFSRAGLNLIVFVDNTDKVVFAKAFDLNSEREVPLPNGIEKYLVAGSLILTHADINSAVTGVLILPGYQLLVSSYSILTSQGKGPARGTVIVGRYLDRSLIEQLSQRIQSSLNVLRIGEGLPQTDIGALLSQTAEETPIVVRPQDGQTVSGYALVRDIYRQPAFVLRVDMPRNIYQQGRATITQFSIIVAVIGIEAFLVLWWLFERQILARLSRIISDIGNVGKSSNLSARIMIEGNDELTQLTSIFNQTLAGLERTQNKIVESEEKYRTLVDNVKLGVFRSTPGPGGRFLEVNKAMEDVTGYTRAELLQMDVSSLYANPEDRETFIKEISSGQSRLTKELDFIRKDGTVIVVADTRVLIKDNRGEALYFDGILEDITERKRAEEEIKRLYKHEQELRLGLEDELAKRVEFTRALVHELRTPLTPILASSDLLVHELKERGVSRLAKNVYEGALNLNRRVEELLDLASGEIGMLHLNLGPVDVLTILKDMFNLAQPLATNSGQTLLAELPPSLPVISADDERVRQIVLNLINNAIKFTPVGGKVTLRARQEQEGNVIEVSDTGRGIDADQLEKLFQPYARSQRDVQRLGGLGLGLALAKKLVELHNGKIWVKSQVGAGSTFGFFLPTNPNKFKTKESRRENSAH